MSPVADFGPLVVETDVDVDVVKLLRAWLPTYLSEVERERGLDPGLLARPRPESYVNALDADEEFGDHALPAIIVTTVSTDDDPDMDGNGTWRVAWRVVVSGVVRGRTPAETRALAALFGGCIRRVMLQKTLGLAGPTRWTGGAVRQVGDATDAGRYLAVSFNEFVVYTDEVVQSTTGPVSVDPSDPEYDPTDPYDPLAAVEVVTINVTST